MSPWKITIPQSQNTTGSLQRRFQEREKLGLRMKALDSDIELLRDGLKRLPVDVQYFIMQDVLSTLNTELQQLQEA